MAVAWIYCVNTGWRCGCATGKRLAFIADSRICVSSHSLYTGTFSSLCSACPDLINNPGYTGTIHFRVAVNQLQDLPHSVTWDVTKISLFLEDGPLERFNSLVAKLQSKYASARTR